MCSCRSLRSWWSGTRTLSAGKQLPPDRGLFVLAVTARPDPSTVTRALRPQHQHRCLILVDTFRNAICSFMNCFRFILLGLHAETKIYAINSPSRWLRIRVEAQFVLASRTETEILPILSTQHWLRIRVYAHSKPSPSRPVGGSSVAPSPVR